MLFKDYKYYFWTIISFFKNRIVIGNKVNRIASHYYCTECLVQFFHLGESQKVINIKVITASKISICWLQGKWTPKLLDLIQTKWNLCKQNVGSPTYLTNQIRPPENLQLLQQRKGQMLGLSMTISGSWKAPQGTSRTTEIGCWFVLVNLDIPGS